MDYLENRISRTEFIKTRGSQRTQQTTQTSLNLFDFFCKGLHHKDGNEVILDIENAIKQDKNHDRLFRLFNSFVLWLQEDHPEAIVQKYKHKTSIKKHNPSTIKGTISTLRQYVEEFGQIEFSERRFQRMVRLPRIMQEDLEPFTKDEIRAFVENATPKRRALYMTLKDSAMRIGEALQLRKKDINLTTNPASIIIQAVYTKTKKSRTTFVTRETKPYLQRLLAKIDDDDLIFGSSNNARQCLLNEEVIFLRARKKLGFTQRYESNGRFKKNLHGLRAFCATQLAELHGEEFAHGFIGHRKYLDQYIRNKDKLAEKYLRAENSLMIFESVVVVEHNDELKKLQLDQQRTQRAIQELFALHSQRENLKLENGLLVEKLRQVEITLEK